jgi:hypothetical protein
MLKDHDNQMPKLSGWNLEHINNKNPILDRAFVGLFTYNTCFAFLKS